MRDMLGMTQVVRQNERPNRFERNASRFCLLRT